MFGFRRSFERRKIELFNNMSSRGTRINIQGGKLLFSDAGEGLGKDGKGWVGKGIIGDRVKGCRGKGEGDQGGREGNHWEGKPPRGS